MEDDKECNTGLSLGLGWGNHESSKVERQKEKSVVCLDLSFTLYPKEKTIMAEDEEEEDGKKRSGGDSKGCKSECGKKKLRLTKEQSSVLEASFKLNTTLNPAQKQALAQRLNLKSRQVEVWFQNRRARTKLKQTEVDCEFLKKCCESLSHENGRLKKELQELRSLRVIGRSPPPQMYHHHHHHLPMVPTTNTTTLAICPSCEKTASGSEEEE